MKTKAFFNRTKRMLAREIKFLEMIQKERRYCLFVEHYGEKANFLSVFSKVTNLYLKIIKSEEEYLKNHPEEKKVEKDSVNEPVTYDDLMIIKDFVKTKEDDFRIAAEKEARIARGEVIEEVKPEDLVTQTYTSPPLDRHYISPPPSYYLSPRDNNSNSHNPNNQSSPPSNQYPNYNRPPSITRL